MKIPVSMRSPASTKECAHGSIDEYSHCRVNLSLLPSYAYLDLLSRIGYGE
jgi:hypothetical protein